MNWLMEFVPHSTMSQDIVERGTNFIGKLGFWKEKKLIKCIFNGKLECTWSDYLIYLLEWALVLSL